MSRGARGGSSGDALRSCQVGHQNHGTHRGTGALADWDLPTCWELTVGCAWYPLVMAKIAMGNVPCIDALPIKNGDFPWRTVK